MKDMTVVFSKPDQPGKSNHVANFDLVFPPAKVGEHEVSLRVTDNALWRGTKESNKETLYVTLAGRLYEKDGDEQKFDFVRSARGDYDDIRRLKDWVIAQYKQQVAAAA